MYIKHLVPGILRAATVGRSSRGGGIGEVVEDAVIIGLSHFHLHAHVLFSAWSVVLLIRTCLNFIHH